MKKTTNVDQKRICQNWLEIWIIIFLTSCIAVSVMLHCTESDAILSLRIKSWQKGVQDSISVLCRYDYVEIHDGNSESADVLGKHCSNIAPAPIISSGPSLHIKFVSDYAHQGAGFSLRYEIFKTGK